MLLAWSVLWCTYIALPAASTKGSESKQWECLTPVTLGWLGHSTLVSCLVLQHARHRRRRKRSPKAAGRSRRASETICEGSNGRWFHSLSPFPRSTCCEAEFPIDPGTELTLDTRTETEAASFTFEDGLPTKCGLQCKHCRQSCR